MTADHFIGHSGIAPQIPISELGGTATLVTYNPEFDEKLQLWFVDVEIDPLNAYYTPFLRLVVCRYQPNSTEGNHVSPLAVTEITQLQPDRVVLVQTLVARKQFRVYYAGIQGLTAKGPNIVIGTLETQASNSPDAPWLPVKRGDDSMEFIVPFSTGPLGMFSLIPNLYEWGSHAENIAKLSKESPGVVTVPNTSSDYRIVVREYEIHPSLAGEPEVAVNNPTIAGRLVHADVIYLNSPGARPERTGNIKP